MTDRDRVRDQTSSWSNTQHVRNNTLGLGARRAPSCKRAALPPNPLGCAHNVTRILCARGAKRLTARPITGIAESGESSLRLWVGGGRGDAACCLTCAEEGVQMEAATNGAAAALRQSSTTRSSPHGHNCLSRSCLQFNCRPVLAPLTLLGCGIGMEPPKRGPRTQANPTPSTRPTRPQR